MQHRIFDFLNNRKGRNRHGLQYISHQFCHFVKVTATDRLNLPVNIRMIRQLTGSQITINKFRRHMNLWLCQQYKAVRSLWQNRQLLTDPLCQRRSTLQTIWNIRPQLYAALLQFLQGKPQTKQPIHADQHCRCIRAATGQPCCHGNVLLQIHRNATFDSKLIDQKLCRTADQIICTGRQIPQIRPQCYPRLRLDCHPDFIIQIHTLHHHTQIVISVLALSQYIQPEIYLCHRL